VAHALDKIGCYIAPIIKSDAKQIRHKLNTILKLALVEQKEEEAIKGMFNKIADSNGLIISRFEMLLPDLLDKSVCPANVGKPYWRMKLKFQCNPHSASEPKELTEIERQFKEIIVRPDFVICSLSQLHTTRNANGVSVFATMIYEHKFIKEHVCSNIGQRQMKNCLPRIFQSSTS
jgi:hypothetical protein